MPDHVVIVRCQLTDCLFYNAQEDDPERCACTHPDKSHYMKDPCILYKQDWQKISQENEAGLKDRFGLGGRKKRL